MKEGSGDPEKGNSWRTVKMLPIVEDEVDRSEYGLADGVR